MEIPDAEITHPFCPTCGRETLVGANPEWLLLHFKGTMARIIAKLCEARRMNESASITDLVRVVYQGEHHYPDHAVLRVQKAVAAMQTPLEELGWVIAPPKVTKKGYYLVPTEKRHRRRYT